MSATDNPLGLTILEGCSQRGWTQAELSKRAGIHSSVMNRIVKGHNNPRTDTLLKIVNAFASVQVDGEFFSGRKPDKELWAARLVLAGDA